RAGPRRRAVRRSHLRRYRQDAAAQIRSSVTTMETSMSNAVTERRRARRLEQLEDHGIIATRVRPGPRARIIDVSAGGAWTATEVAQFGRILVERQTSPDGTGFGSRDGMPLHTPRQRDRRQALADLLGALTRSLDRRLDVSLMRGSFEVTLRRAMPLRAVHLREGGSHWPNQADGISAPESMALEVPGADPD